MDAAWRLGIYAAGVDIGFVRECGMMVMMEELQHVVLGFISSARAVLSKETRDPFHFLISYVKQCLVTGAQDFAFHQCAVRCVVEYA